MNKGTLIKKVAQELNGSFSQSEIRTILDAAVKIKAEALNKGETVRWTGFGSFVVKEIPPRRFYSPKRKEYMTSSGVKKIVFVEPRKQKPHSEFMSKLE